jgi:hypothetical protein
LPEVRSSEFIIVKLMFTKTSPSKMILMEKFLIISKRGSGEKAKQTLNLLPGFLGSKGYLWD